MRKTSAYYELKFVVECKWPHNHHFEPIAAFNVQRIAEEYAASAWAGQAYPGWSYRVMERAGDKFKEVYRAEDGGRE